jgi:alpha-D-ribose 1-methylphosphonate 5-triphosphate diphosphatase
MIALRAQRIVCSETIVEEAWVVVEGERIAGIETKPPPRARAYDLGRVDLVPGAVDLHCDCLENLAHPRPSASLPLEAALYELDSYVLMHGVTTNYLCIGLEDDATKHRSDARAIETESLVRRLRPTLRADVLVHLRVDVTRESADLVRELVEHGIVGLISYMDHTPGQGQYPDEEGWRRHYQSRWGASDEVMERRLAAKRSGRSRTDAMRAEIAEIGRRYGVIVAAHDDDCASAIERGRLLGVRISEFPVNAEAALAAARSGIGIVMGAPNARRGRSHLTNLSAREALRLGVLDALASDYHPPSMFAAAYLLAAEGLCEFTKAIALVTSGPARLAGLYDRGRIAPGMRADLAAIELRAGHPVVRQTWVRGVPVLGVVPALEGSHAS